MPAPVMHSREMTEVAEERIRIKLVDGWAGEGIVRHRAGKVWRIDAMAVICGR